VRINDVFFSDGDDDDVIKAVEQELRLKSPFLNDDFEVNRLSVSGELEDISEESEELSDLEKQPDPSHLIKLKAKRSFFEDFKGDNRK